MPPQLLNMDIHEQAASPDFHSVNSKKQVSKVSGQKQQITCITDLPSRLAQS